MIPFLFLNFTSTGLYEKPDTKTSYQDVVACWQSPHSPRPPSLHRRTRYGNVDAILPSLIFYYYFLSSSHASQDHPLLLRSHHPARRFISVEAAACQNTKQINLSAFQHSTTDNVFRAQVRLLTAQHSSSTQSGSYLQLAVLLPSLKINEQKRKMTTDCDYSTVSRFNSQHNRFRYIPPGALRTFYLTRPRMKSHLASDKKERCVNHFHVDQNYFRQSRLFNLKAFTRPKRVASTRNTL